MKLITLALATSLTALLATPVMAGDDFGSAKTAAKAEIDKAKAVDYEWRDSRKILKKAEAAEKAGDHDKAMKLANQAKQQGIIAVAQSKQQSEAGPR